MAETDIWLAEFGERQNQADNRGIYWTSLLVLLTGTVALLWSLPTPAEFAEISPFLNWGSALLMASIVYYFIISPALGLGMVPFMWGVGAIQIWLESRSIPMTYTSCVLIGAAIAGLSLGHYARGGIRAVMRDVQLVMIAPLWLLSTVYKRFGIPF